MKKNKKILLIVLGALLLAIAGIVLYQQFNKAPQTQAGLISPISTDAKNGYLSSSSQVVASGTAQVVEDTGAPRWTQVKSEDTLSKFTDLSRGDLIIYRANNPKALKTATSIYANGMTMRQMIAQYPNSLIMNMSGFNFLNGLTTGFQINNGQLFQDWGYTNNDSYAFVINKNGTSGVYDSRTPASTILANGAAQSYSFGTILIRNGKVQPNDGSVNWEIHSFIATDARNNLYLIISKTQAGYQNIMDTLAPFHLENLVLMDGGGSSQLSLNGKIIFPSQDNRAVADYIVLR